MVENAVLRRGVSKKLIASGKLTIHAGISSNTIYFFWFIIMHDKHISINRTKGSRNCNNWNAAKFCRRATVLFLFRSLGNAYSLITNYRNHFTRIEITIRSEVCSNWHISERASLFLTQSLADMLKMAACVKKMRIVFEVCLYVCTFVIISYLPSLV